MFDKYLLLPCHKLYIVILGLGGRLTIVDVGGPPYLLPTAQKDKLYDIQPLLQKLKYGDRAFVAGAGAGPWPYLNSNCEVN
jgi:hypothetical protein